MSLIFPRVKNLFSDITPPDDYVPDKIALPMR